MKSLRDDIQLLVPDVKRDAPFALSWFERPEGKDTLLSMGNAEKDISTPTLEGQEDIIREFVALESSHKQITRMISVEGKTIGAVWIELIENHCVKPPSVHIMIGNPDYRKRGIGLYVMRTAIGYIRDTLHVPTIYSRHLVGNQGIIALNQALGFKNDGKPYTDENGLVWQNVKLTTKVRN